MSYLMTLVRIFILVIFLFTNQSSNAMEKKNIKEINVLMYSMTTTLATIMTDPGQVPYEIVAKAQELGLEIAGPQIWQYVGVDGKPDTEFKLDICLPVKEAKGDAGKFRFEVLPEINCISEIHKGSWKNLANTYSRLFGEMSRKGIIPNGESREVYHAYDLENEEKNVTEIQIVLN